MRSEGIVCRVPRQDRVEAQIWEEYQKIAAALKNTVAYIILKWKKFGTTKTAGRPAKLSNRGRRAMVREVTKNLMVTLISFVEMG